MHYLYNHNICLRGCPVPARNLTSLVLSSLLTGSFTDTSRVVSIEAVVGMSSCSEQDWRHPGEAADSKKDREITKPNDVLGQGSSAGWGEITAAFPDTEPMAHGKPRRELLKAETICFDSASGERHHFIYTEQLDFEGFVLKGMELTRYLCYKWRCFSAYDYFSQQTLSNSQTAKSGECEVLGVVFLLFIHCFPVN